MPHRYAAKLKRLSDGRLLFAANGVPKNQRNSYLLASGRVFFEARVLDSQMQGNISVDSPLSQDQPGLT